MNNDELLEQLHSKMRVLPLPDVAPWRDVRGIAAPPPRSRFLRLGPALSSAILVGATAAATLLALVAHHTATPSTVNRGISAASPSANSVIGGPTPGTSPTANTAPVTSASAASSAQTSPTANSHVSLAPPPQQANCASPANVPDGRDAWGGCYPGPSTSGVPSGTHMTSVSAGETAAQAIAAGAPADNDGWSVDPDGQIRLGSGGIIDGITDPSGVYVPGTTASATIRNSDTGGITDQGSSLLVDHSTVNGGNQSTYPTIDASGSITVQYSNISAGPKVQCDSGCTIENSYIHDSATGGTASQYGIVDTGGSNISFIHNTVGCTVGCQSDLSLSTGNLSNANVSRNLLLWSQSAANCVQPGPNSPSQSYSVSGISWTDNVFQRGPGGQCSPYGPVYGWYPSLCHPTACNWTNNRWDDGSALSEP